MLSTIKILCMANHANNLHLSSAKASQTWEAGKGVISLMN
jgi:hypothetical protein